MKGTEDCLSDALKGVIQCDWSAVGNARIFEFNISLFITVTKFLSIPSPRGRGKVRDREINVTLPTPDLSQRRKIITSEINVTILVPCYLNFRYINVRGTGAVLFSKLI